MSIKFLKTGIALLVATSFASPVHAASQKTITKADAKPAQVADDASMDAALMYLQASVIRDVDFVFARSIDLPKGSYVGMGSGTGTDFSLEYAAGHLAGLQRVAWDDLDIQGHTVDDVGWFTGTALGVLPDGRELPIRITVVLRKVGDQWFTVHHHISEGVSRSGIKKEE